MEIYLTDSNNDPICFNHAVEAAIKDKEYISIKSADDSGQSGCWWVGGCKKCEEERENKK